MDLPADGNLVSELAESMANIQVESYSSLASEERHGFAKPFATVSAVFAVEAAKSGVSTGERDRTGSKTVVLEIGQEASENSRFARVVGAEESAVFLLGRSYLESLIRPAVARDLVSLDLQNVFSMEVKTPESSRSFEKRGDTWVAVDGKPFDEARFAQHLNNLEGLKAIRAESYGTNTGLFRKPTMTIVFQQAGKDPSSPPLKWIVGPQTDVVNSGGFRIRIE